MLSRVDYFPIDKKQMIRIVFESSESHWRQGVSLHLSQRGRLIINGEVRNSVVLWHDPKVPEVLCEVDVKSPVRLEVKNVWDNGRGKPQYGELGAAMLILPCENGRRYLCNDAKPDDDFDDIIFRVERVEASEAKPEPAPTQE